MKRFSFFNFLCLFFVVIFASAQTVLALSPEQKKLYNKNILYYDLGCSNVNTNTAASDDASSGTSIFVIGDSLSVGMRDSGGLKQKLQAKDWEVTGYEATSGISLSSSIAKIDANRQAVQRADTVLVELGTNGAESSAIEQMINKIKSVKASSQNPDVQILWQNIYSTKTSQYPTFPAFNQNLNAKQSQGKINKVLDWKKEATDNPSKYDLDRDSLGIHPQAADGYKKMAEWVVDQTGRAGGGGGSDSTGPSQPGGASSSSIEKIFVVGDSVAKVADTAVNIPNLKQRFSEKGIESIIKWSGGAATNGYGGEFGTNGVQMLQDNRNEIGGADAVVVAMGTNDDPGAMASGIEEMVQKIKNYNNSADIFWVNTHTQAPSNSAWTAAGSRQKNETIQQKSSSLGYTVIDVTNAGFDFASDDIHPAYDVENGIGKWMNVVVDSVSEGAGAESEASANLCECPSGGSASLTGRDNEEKIWNFFIGKGLDDVHVAAIIGNWKQEAGEDLDPTIVNGIGATGLAQWLGDRKAALSSRDDPLTIETQIQFAYDEFLGENGVTAQFINVGVEPSGTYEEWLAENDLAVVTEFFRRAYERPGEAEANDAQRIVYARDVLDRLGGSGGGGGSGSSGCGESSSVPADCEQLSGTPKEIIDNVVIPIAEGIGDFTAAGRAPLSPESVDAANADHGPTVDGTPSDHQGPSGERWAADISNGTNPTPEMDELAKALADCFELPAEHWEGNLDDGRDNQCNSTTSKGGYRIQLIYRTQCSGNHDNHVHIGIQKE